MWASSCWKRRSLVRPVRVPDSSFLWRAPKSASLSGSSLHERGLWLNMRLQDNQRNQVTRNKYTMCWLIYNFWGAFLTSTLWVLQSLPVPRAVHGFQCKDIIFHREGEHVFTVVLPMTRFLPQFAVINVGGSYFLKASSPVLFLGKQQNQKKWLNLIVGLCRYFLKPRFIITSGTTTQDSAIEAHRVLFIYTYTLYYTFIYYWFPCNSCYCSALEKMLTLKMWTWTLLQSALTEKEKHKTCTSWTDSIAVIRSQPPGSINTIPECLVMCLQCQGKGFSDLSDGEMLSFLFFLIDNRLQWSDNDIAPIQCNVCELVLAWSGVMVCDVSLQDANTSLQIWQKKVCSTFRRNVVFLRNSAYICTHSGQLCGNMGAAQTSVVGLHKIKNSTF